MAGGRVAEEGEEEGREMARGASKSVHGHNINQGVSKREI